VTNLFSFCVSSNFGFDDIGAKTRLRLLLIIIICILLDALLLHEDK